jgi:Uncharacterized membrane protein (homolog of Drosophila rhomboid)
MENHEDENSEEWTVITAQSVTGVFEDHSSHRRVSLWALVLHARAIPCKTVQEANGVILMTHPEFLDTAIRELRLFEEENRNWPLPPPPAPPPFTNFISTLSILLLLAIFHNIEQLGPILFNVNMPDWVELGSANAGKIMNGEWWRIITALTLHADSLHLVGNLLIGGIFVMLICAELGSGLAWFLLIASGAFGNFLNAAMHPPAHTSLGASTALFGAVGILAASGVVRYRRHLLRQRILPLAAALALLAILGTEGEKTDLGAHLFGFISGLGLGGTAHYLVMRHDRPGALNNTLLALCSMLLVLIAWWLAITRGTI